MGAVARLKNLTYLKDADVLVRRQVPITPCEVLTLVALVEAAETKLWYKLNPTPTVGESVAVPEVLIDPLDTTTL